ncbi:MAG: beta-propeller fold lactonase family protein [Pirellulaceae bacterium]|nr:beta-propeller fold lactonase family protein [Pirellulaceae bacterium]
MLRAKGGPGSAGLAGSPGTAGTNPTERQLGADDGGDGGTAGRGGDGGAGGAGSGGGGGSGGSVKLFASILNAAKTSVNTSGGLGGIRSSDGVRSPNGGDGRFIYGSNVGGGTPGTLTGISNFNLGFNLGTGQQRPNLWTSDFIDTPMIAGLAGGADVAGLLEKSLTALPTDIQLAISSQKTPNALAAIVRVDATQEILSQLVDGISISSDDYVGYDLLLFVNVSNIPLGRPTLGINVEFEGVVLDSTYSRVLATGGATRSLTFGGSEPYTPLTALNPGSVWATLIPNGTVRINAAIDGSVEALSNKTFANVSIKVEMIKAVQPGLSIASRLQGLTSIALSPDGKNIYAVNTAENALVVINAANLTERQLIKQGDIVQAGTGTTTADGLIVARSLVVSPDGKAVYVAGEDATGSGQRILFFKREPLTGQLSELVETYFFDRATNFTILLNSTGTQLLASGQIIQVFDIQPTGKLKFNQAIGSSGVGATRLDLKTASGNFVYATNESSDALIVYNATTFALADKVVSTPSGLDGVDAVAAANGFVYVTGAIGDSLTVFQQATDGKLTQIQQFIEGVGGVRGIRGNNDVRITPDSQYVIVSGDTSSALAIFKRDTTTGKLKFVQLLRNNTGGAEGLLNPTSMAIKADGSKLYVGSAGATNTPGGIVVFDLNSNAPQATALLTAFKDIEEITVSTAGGDDTLTLPNAPGSDVKKLTINTGDGNDRVVISDLISNNPNSPETPTTIVNLGLGTDNAQLRSVTEKTSVVVNGETGKDTISILGNGSQSFIVVNGGPDEDTVQVNGVGLNRSSTTIVHGDAPTSTPGDKLEFGSQNHIVIPAVPTFPDGTLQVNFFDETSPLLLGILQYDSFENTTITKTPLVRFISNTGRLDEGQNNFFVQVEVTPVPGGTGKLTKALEWDFDGDGQFGDVIGNSVFDGTTEESLSLTWDQLVALGIKDDGVYTFAVRATNVAGISEAKGSFEVRNTAPTVRVRGQEQDPNAGKTTGNGKIGATYTIVFSATDPGDDHVQEWRVNWGDGTGETFGSGVETATHTYTKPTAEFLYYSISVAVVDEDSAPNAYPTNSDVNGHTIAIAVDSTDVSAGGAYTVPQGKGLTLSGSASGDFFSLDWDLNGDGDFSDATGTAPTLTWAQLNALGIERTKEYTIAARARYANGIGSDFTTTPAVTTKLVVTNVAPTATLSNSGPINETGSATVTFSNQSDPSATDQANLRYSYDFNNNGVFDVGVDIENSTSTTVTVPAALLAQNGILTVRGVVIDRDGALSEAFTNITINDVSPTLALTATSTSLFEGGTFTISLQVTEAGNDLLEKINIDWGDGVVEPFSGDVRSFTHTYGNNGSFTVKATAFDLDGQYSATFGTPVSVTNVLPVVSDVSAFATTEGGDFNLTGKITDPGTGDLFTVKVNWGDGGAQEIITLAPGTSLFQLGHRYADNRPSANPYAISVDVSDDDLTKTSSASTTVAVSNVPPTIVFAAFVKDSYFENEETTLVGIIDDVGILDTHTLSIAWGDGTTSTAPVEPVTRTFIVTHVYTGKNAAGAPQDVYTATITLLDNDGGQVSGDASVIISNVAPVITSLSIDKLEIKENEQVDITGTFIDVGLFDSATVMVNWGDGTVSPGTVDLAKRTFTASHRYLDDNPSATSLDGFLISVTITDKDGGETTRVLETAVRHTIGDTTAAKAAIEAARDSKNSLTATNINLVYDGTNVPVVVPAFSSAEGLRQFVQTAIDNALIAERLPRIVVVSLGALDRLIINPNASLGDTTAAEALMAAARDINNNLDSFTFDLVLDAKTITVSVGSFSSVGALLSHVQQALDQSFSTSGAGIPSQFDPKQNLRLIAKIDSDKMINFSTGRDLIDGVRYDLLGDTTAAQAAIAAVRTGNNLTAPVKFSLLFSGSSIPISVAAGNFADASGLRAHIQAAIDNALSLSKAESVGKLVATLASNDEIAFLAFGPTSITVKNVAPVFTRLTNSAKDPGSLLPPNRTVTVSGDFAETGTLDSHEVIVNWGDGTAASTLSIPAGTSTFTLNHDYAAGGDYLIRVTLSDDDGGQTVRMTQVGSNNESPIAANDTTKMIVGGTIDIAVLNNDTDADGNGTINTASVVLIDLPVVGVATVQSNGTIRYAAPAGFLGQISFSYTVADNLQFLSNTALVTVDIVGTSYQNPRNRFDVNDDGNVSPIDVLQVINALRRGGSRLLGPTDFVPPPYIDVDGSNSVEPLDVLQVINEFRRRSRTQVGEGESQLIEFSWIDSISTPSVPSATTRQIDQTLSDPAYIDFFNIRKRAKIIDVAFSEFGKDFF